MRMQAALFATLAAAVLAKQPNVLFILTDDQDQLLGSMQYMPKARQLLMEAGTTFTHMLAATPVCCPSRSTFVTGRYIHSVGVTNNSIPGNCNGLAWQQGPELNNFGYLMSQQGYRTGYTGKFLNTYASPSVGGVAQVPRGWDTWRTLRGNSIYYNYEISTADCTKDGKMKTGGCIGVAQKHGHDYTLDYLPLVIHNNTLDFIRGTPGDDRPFFWVAATPSCHQVADPAPQYAELYPAAEAPRTPTYNQHYPDTHWFAASQGVLDGPMDDNSREFTDLLARRRWQTLASVDDIVEDAINLLNSMGELDNTYIIYTSDHGYHLGERGLDLDKRQMYETDTRMPFFVRGPNIPANASSDFPVANVDIAATLLDIAGVTDKSVLDALDGESMLPKLPAANGDHRSPVAGDGMRQHVLIEYHGEHNQGGNAPVCPGNIPGWEQMNCYVQSNGTVPPWFYGTDFCSCQDTTNNTYSCARTLNSTHNYIYCQFVNGFVEAYNMDLDPWQQTNLASTMPAGEHAYWQSLLDELRNCTGPTCGRSAAAQQGKAVPVDSHPRTAADLRGPAWAPMFPGRGTAPPASRD